MGLSLLVAMLAFAGDRAAKDTLSYSILGDSYSTYEGCLTPDTNLIWYFRPENKELHRNNDVRQVEQTWWHQVIKGMKGKLELNNSYSGSTVCYTGYKDKQGVNQDYSDRAFITRSNKLGNPDVILVCGATNDSWAGAPIGEYVYGNWTREELYYFRPAMAKWCLTMKELYPRQRIVFIINTDLKPDFVESMKLLLDRYGIEYLQLKKIDKQYGHPSVKGMRSMADQVVEYLRKNS